MQNGLVWHTHQPRAFDRAVIFLCAFMGSVLSIYLICLTQSTGQKRAHSLLCWLRLWLFRNMGGLLPTVNVLPLRRLLERRLLHDKDTYLWTQRSAPVLCRGFVLSTINVDFICVQPSAEQKWHEWNAARRKGNWEGERGCLCKNEGRTRTSWRAVIYR
jgi:hypothetical protein